MEITYEIRDKKDNLIGRAKPNTVSKYENLSFFDPNKNELLRINFVEEGKGYYWSELEIKDFEIIQPDRKTIAKVQVQELKFRQDSIWTIDILDSAYDRKIILGLIMSFFSSAFDSRPRDSGASG